MKPATEHAWAGMAWQAVVGGTAQVCKVLFCRWCTEKGQVGEGHVVIPQRNRHKEIKIHKVSHSSTGMGRGGRHKG